MRLGAVSLASFQVFTKYSQLCLSPPSSVQSCAGCKMQRCKGAKAQGWPGDELRQGKTRQARGRRGKTRGNRLRRNQKWEARGQSRTEERSPGSSGMRPQSGLEKEDECEEVSHEESKTTAKRRLLCLGCCTAPSRGPLDVPSAFVDRFFFLCMRRPSNLQRPGLSAW